MALGHSDDRFRRGGCGRERGRHIHHQHGVVLAVVEQGFQRRGVSRFVGVAGDVDRVGA